MKNGLKIGLAVLAIAIVVMIFVGTNGNGSVETESKNVDMLGVEAKYATVSEEVNYYEGYTGYLARPEEEGNYPGVIMIHEWWGLNDNIKEMADNLASQGYIVLAVDLYGEVATEPSKAGELAGKVRNNQNEALDNMMAAINYLEENEGATKMATLGWCFGGGQSLQASLNEDVDATVIYYGNLVTDKENLSSIKSPVLGIFGSMDNSIPVSEVYQFGEALDELGIENEIYIYEGVGHAFANPSGANYAPDETSDAWKKTLAFLESKL